MTQKRIMVAALLATLLIAIMGLIVREAVKPELRSFTLRYLNGNEAADLVLKYLPPGALEGVEVSTRKGSGEYGGTIFVRASEDVLNKVAEVLQKEDTPKPQAALRFQVIEANGFATTDSAIAPVEKKLRELFRFDGYRLSAETFLMAKENGYAEQTFIGEDGTPYILRVTVGEVLRREGKASAQLEVQLYANAASVLATSVNVPDGQTLVLGTARPDARRGALILVVNPEIR